jgi:hypothetical protein
VHLFAGDLDGNRVEKVKKENFAMVVRNHFAQNTLGRRNLKTLFWTQERILVD